MSMEQNTEKNTTASENSNVVSNTHSKTRIQVEEYTHTWVIQNFSHCKYRIKLNSTLPSPIFETRSEKRKYQWELIIVPNYLDLSDDISYCSFILERPLPLLGPENPEEALLRIALVDGNGAEVIASETSFTLTKTNNFPTAFEKFAMSSDVYERAVFDGDLTIRCKLSFYDGIVNDPDSDPRFAATTDSVSRSDDFERLLESQRFGDVKLVVGDKEFHVYKGIMAARSRVFSAMFEHDMRESSENVVEISDVEPDIMQEVLRFVYSGRVKNVEASAARLLAAADKYDLGILKLMCEGVLIDKLSVDNLYEVLILVDRYETSKLRTAGLRFLAVYGKEVAAIENFEKNIQSLSKALLADVTKALMLKF